MGERKDVAYASLIAPDVAATDTELGAMSPRDFPNTSRRAHRRCSRFGILGGVAFSAVAFILIAGDSSALLSGDMGSALGFSSEGGYTWYKLRGAIFSATNYYTPLADYMRRAKGFSGWETTYMATQDWYSDLATSANPMVGHGLGDHTTLYYAYDTVKAKLASMGARIAAGTLERESALGITAYNNVPWPEAGRFALGFTNADHAFVRPYLDAMLDGQGDKDAWLKPKYQKLFASLNKFWLGDIHGFNCKILHEITLNMSVTDDQCSDIKSLADQILIPAAVPPKAAESWISRRFVVKPVLERKAVWLTRYRAAILAKWPYMLKGGEWTERELTLLTSAYLDMMLQAGGRSVPTVVSFMLGYIYQPPSSPHYLGAINYKNNRPALTNLMYEVMRYYPAVGGIPMWVKNLNSTQTSWNYELLILEMAFKDASQFPNPSVFQPGRPGLKYNDTSKSIAWADFALVNGDNANPDSHACPGKKLSISMILGFIEELLAADTWKPSTTGITFTNYEPTSFKLTKESYVEPSPWWPFSR